MRYRVRTHHTYLQRSSEVQCPKCKFTGLTLVSLAWCTISYEYDLLFTTTHTTVVVDYCTVASDHLCVHDRYE